MSLGHVQDMSICFKLDIDISMSESMYVLHMSEVCPRAFVSNMSEVRLRARVLNMSELCQRKCMS